MLLVEDASAKKGPAGVSELWGLAKRLRNITSCVDSGMVGSGIEGKQCIFDELRLPLHPTPRALYVGS